MPMISRFMPFSAITRPITAGSPPNLVFQSESLRITTASRPGEASPGAKARPRATGAPSTESRFAVAVLPKIRIAAPLPVRLNSDSCSWPQPPWFGSVPDRKARRRVDRCP